MSLPEPDATHDVPTIVIRFKGPASTDMNVDTKHTNRGQMLLAAAYLQAIADAWVTSWATDFLGSGAVIIAPGPIPPAKESQ